MRPVFLSVPVLVVTLSGCSLFKDPCERMVEAYGDCGYSEVSESSCSGVSDDDLKCMADKMEDGCDDLAACQCAFSAQECSGGDTGYDSGYDTGWGRR